jgi:hypothetical protein
MEVMIGVDPHKRSHTATMLDRAARKLRRITVRAGRRQVEQLLEWADGYGARTWAVEAIGGMGYSVRSCAPVRHPRCGGARLRAECPSTASRVLVSSRIEELALTGAQRSSDMAPGRFSAAPLSSSPIHSSKGLTVLVLATHFATQSAANALLRVHTGWTNLYCLPCSRIN